MAKQDSPIKSKERFTTLSPVLDTEQGKATGYPVFNGDLPADNVGYLPKEGERGKRD